MTHEQEPEPYIYIGSAFPGSERVQQFTDIVKEFGLAVRKGEPDMFTSDPIRADRTVRERLIANSVGVILDLRVTTFTVTADLKYADQLHKPKVLGDLDPKSHRARIHQLIVASQNGSISTLG